VGGTGSRHAERPSDRHGLALSVPGRRPR
jgi:hypothetical protein